MTDPYRDLDVAWINDTPLISRVRHPKGADSYIEILDEQNSLRVMWDYITRLEPVTRGENTRRAPWTQVTHCKYGHEYTPENTHIQVQNGYRMRSCLTCRREYSQRKRSS